MFDPLHLDSSGFMNVFCNGNCKVCNRNHNCNCNFRPLDRETMSSYSFDAVATDACLYGPRSQTVRVDVRILDVNDNSPRFTQNIYSVDIRPDHPVSGLIRAVSATDADVGLNARITYLLADDDSTYFQVGRLYGCFEL